MANELIYNDGGNPGLTTYYTVLQVGNQIVNASTGALQTFNSSNWQSSAIALTDANDIGAYLGSIPANTPAGEYTWTVYPATGTPSSTAAIGDIANAVSSADTVNWSGTKIVTLADIAAGTVSPGPGLATVTATTYDANGATQSGVVIEYRVVASTGVAGRMYPGDTKQLTSDSDGLVSASLVQGTTYQVRRDSGTWQTFTVRVASADVFPEAIGRGQG